MCWMVRENNRETQKVCEREREIDTYSETEIGKIGLIGWKIGHQRGGVTSWQTPNINKTA